MRYKGLLLCAVLLEGSSSSLPNKVLHLGARQRLHLKSDFGCSLYYERERGGLYTKGRALLRFALEAEANGHAHIEDVRCLLDL